MRLLQRLVVVLLVAAAPVGVYLAPATEHAPAHPAVWDERVRPLVDFVERERGLLFAHPVRVRFLDDDAFDEHVTLPEADRQRSREEAAQLLAVLRALGLVSGAPDLQDSLDELLAAAVVGLYDTDTDELLVQGTQLTPLVRATIVHELTHALQDQHFDLDKLDEQAPAGAESAVEALVEGDAERIEEAYVAAMSEPDGAAFHRGNQAEDLAQVPDVLEHLMAFPYVFGPVLLDAVAARGNAAVDTAFTRPPVSEAQVLDPVTYPLSFQPVRVEDPAVPDGAEAVDEPGAFGQFTLFEVLGSRLGFARAWAAVQGWAGDRYRLFELEGRTCVAFTTRMTGADAARRLGDALHQWSMTTEAAVQRAGNAVLVRACDPGDTARPPVRDPAAFDVLAVRAALVHLGVRQGRLQVGHASCVVDGVLGQLGERGVGVLLADELEATEHERLGRLFATAQQRCA